MKFKKRFPFSCTSKTACTLAGALLAISMGGVALQSVAASGETNPCAGGNPCAVMQTCGANPCAEKNPCAGANPCAEKNPCAIKQKCGACSPCGTNPCAEKNPCAGANPCAGKNPCAASGCGACNPCEASSKNPCAVKRPDGYSPRYSESEGNAEALIAQGKDLFQDTSLSTNGMSCSSCHGADGNQGYQATFGQAYPHQVAMGQNMYGMEQVHADEMVQICMLTPMAADTLAWDSDELAALSAYVVELQRREAGESHSL
ncbi:hypothetical protein L861_11285 [Litchfieldella anticariensis FP35 = DSM 16096]|uniref:Cytochrome c domain-containing protein n=1 Tax=Litchfieldella anticariensis (strain DSM 16096 / CECT 5854 / CIP 108499 / LMG 22089 / FP35) TaxID=1121939 RepID=S2KGS7_LITA3|nr:c-type cytochrome [Halomonas anticariensis]EPC01150.1 hypothetical protein L861_11285 [Halomonas anticariensis FP35 = DSM 16096]